MVCKVAILGVDGNMGQLISKMVLEDPDLPIVAGFSIPNSPNLGKDIGSFMGRSELGVEIENVEKMIEICSLVKPDVVIDFTVAKGTEKNAPLLVNAGIPVVIGTTGMDDAFKDSITQLCQEKGCSIVLSSNMATGVNVFFKIAQEITKYLKDWDIEVIEAHHHRKRDSPSGTAMTIAEKIAEVLDKNLNDVATFGRNKGPNPRKIGAEEIGIHAVRAGDIVGDHTVLYAGPGERIELVHRAHSRECFASGTLPAAKFLQQHAKTGLVYDMQDVLELK